MMLTQDEIQPDAIMQSGTIEKTGAGDTFGGCCLHYVLEYGIDGLTEQRMHEMLCFADAGTGRNRRINETDGQVTERCLSFL